MQSESDILYVDWESPHDEILPVLKNGLSAQAMPYACGVSFDEEGLSLESAVEALQPLLPMRKEVWGAPFLMDFRHPEASRWNDCIGFGWSWFFHLILVVEHGRLGGMLLACGGGNDESEWLALRRAVVALDRVRPSVLIAPTGGLLVSDQASLDTYFDKRRSHRWA